VHPIFALEKLRKAASSPPLSGQIQDPTPPMEVNGSFSITSDGEDMIWILHGIQRGTSGIPHDWFATSMRDIQTYQGPHYTYRNGFKQLRMTSIYLITLMMIVPE
ncbi:hypothetical protein IFM53868_10994, partial [Aspergillus udagawae]